MRCRPLSVAGTLLLYCSAAFDGIYVMTPWFRTCLAECLLVIGLGICLPMAADEVVGNPDAPFFLRSWQVEQGLPNNTVNAITQTHDGYLWLGTDEGLARFDGVRCRVFGLQDGLKNLQISALMEDRRGGLWIGTAGGGVARMVHDEIKTYTIKDGLAGDSISSFVEATNGDVWISTHTGLSCWHNSSFEPVAKELGPIFVYDLAKDRQGDILAATLHNGLLRFHDGKYSVADGETGTITNNPRCVLVDSKNRVWAGLRGRTILCCENGIWTRYGTNDGYSDAVPYRLSETADGTVWAGSENGLYYFNNGRFNVLQKSDGLSDDAVLSLYTDRERFLWVGTQAGGLNRVGPKKLSVYHLMSGSSECQLRSLAQTSGGELWVGTYGQGLFLWQGKQAERFLDDFVYRGHWYVEAVLDGRDGSLWRGAGPSLYQWKDGKLLYHCDDTPWLISDRVWSLCEDRDEGMWVGTYNGKIGLLKQRVFTPLNGFSGKPVTALAQEPDGTLWVGSLGGGLTRLQNTRLTVFTTKDGLQSDLIRALLLDADGTLWIGTDGGGLNRWSHGRMAGFTMQQGLLDNIILQILADDDGCLWLGCNRGICRVSKRVLNDVAEGKSNFVHPMNFGTSEGMSSEECIGNFGAALKTQAGQLCFATVKGIVVIDPRQQPHVAPALMAMMEDVLVDKQILKCAPLPASARTDFSVGGSPGSAVTVPAGRHSFEFQYTSIGYETPDKTRFRYRLEGLDPGWIEAGGLRAAHYSYIPPGSYRFRVQACNPNGQWEDRGAGMSFVVLPYFWQTLWFEMLLTFILVGLIAAGIRLVYRRRYQARIKRIEYEQATERERMRIARDLHDELGSSLTHISMLSDIGWPITSSEDWLKKLEKRVRKVSAVSVNTVRSLDGIVWAVNPRNDSLNSLLLYLMQYARELFEDSGILCRFQIPENLSKLPLPPEMRYNIFLAVKEALNNALKHSRGMEISLSAKTDGRRIEICVQDNGAGFAPANNRAGGERNGLENMRQRIEGIGGRFTVETNLGSGTTIRMAVDCSATVLRQNKK